MSGVKGMEIPLISFVPDRVIGVSMSSMSAYPLMSSLRSEARVFWVWTQPFNNRILENKLTIRIRSSNRDFVRWGRLGIFTIITTYIAELVR